MKINSYVVYAFLAAIIALSVVLEIQGLGWGLPDTSHGHHSFHPDETASLASSFSILLSPQRLYPTKFALVIGPMQFYVVARVYQVIYGTRIASFAKSVTPRELRNLYLTGRIVTVCMLAGAVLLLFFITRKMFGEICALLATLICVVLPAIVVNAHYYRPDIPAMFWILASFLFSLHVMKSGKLKFYMLSAACAGFAAATRYNSILVLIPLLYAHIMNRYKTSQSLSTMTYANTNIALSFLTCIGAFFIGAPGNLLYWHEFSTSFLKELSFQTENVLIESIGYGPGWSGFLLRILPFAMGVPCLIISCAGILYALWRRSKNDIMILTWIIPYYITLGLSSVWVVRYTVPLMPFFSVLGAHLIVDITANANRVIRYCACGVSIATIAFTLLMSLKLDGIMAAQDPRIKAYDWMNEHVAPGTPVGFDFTPAAFFPSFDTQRYRPIPMNMDTTNIRFVDYYIANDQIYLHYMRLGRRYPSQAHYLKRILTGTEFVKVAQFENVFNPLGIRYRKIDIPHDYLYFMPSISIYERRK